MTDAMRILGTLASLACFLALAGCIPIPNRTMIAPAIRGTVSDANTGQPIHGAIVVHRFDAEIQHSAVTAKDGTFSIKSLSQRHWGYLVGIALNYPLPHPKLFRGQSAITYLRVIEPAHKDYQQEVQYRMEERTSTRSVRGLTVFEIKLTPSDPQEK